MLPRLAPAHPPPACRPTRYFRTVDRSAAAFPDPLPGMQHLLVDNAGVRCCRAPVAQSLVWGEQVAAAPSSNAAAALLLPVPPAAGCTPRLTAWAAASL